MPRTSCSRRRAQRFQSNELVDGDFPKAPGEVAVDVALAKREKLTLGQAVGLSTRTGVEPVRLVGTFKFGDSTSIGGATLTAVTFDDAQRWFDRENLVNAIVVAADPGVSADSLARRIEPSCRATCWSRPSTENTDRQASNANNDLGFLRDFLFVFAFIAVLVGAFIIFNVFSITVAQRVRELAMLRTMGASRRQIMRSVLIEAAVIGLIASIIGIGVGVLFAMLLNRIFDAAGFGLPTTGITLQARTVLWPLIVGVVVTLIAAVIPAVRATRVAPVAVLREGAVLPKSRFSRFTPYVGILFGLIGVLAIVAGFGTSAASARRWR